MLIKYVTFKNITFIVFFFKKQHKLIVVSFVKKFTAVIVAIV